MSIEERPKEIETREEFGHWEMDTVVGKQGISKKSFLGSYRAKNKKRDYRNPKGAYSERSRCVF